MDAFLVFVTSDTMIFGLNVVIFCKRSQQQARLDEAIQNCGNAYKLLHVTPRLTQVPLAQREKIRKQIRADTKDILVKRVFFLQPLHPLFLSTYKNMVSLFTLLLPRRCICLSRNFDGLCWFPDILRRHKLGQAKLNFLVLKDL